MQHDVAGHSPQRGNTTETAVSPRPPIKNSREAPCPSFQVRRRQHDTDPTPLPKPKLRSEQTRHGLRRRIVNLHVVAAPDRFQSPHRFARVSVSQVPRYLQRAERSTHAQQDGRARFEKPCKVPGHGGKVSTQFRPLKFEKAPSNGPSPWSGAMSSVARTRNSTSS